MKKLALTLCSVAIIAGALIAGVAAQVPRPITDENGWLFSTNDIDERFARIAKHFRGYDNAMLEVGQRFQTVYDALKDENYDLAEYHFVKIKLAMENGILKRPKRAENTQNMFINAVYSPVLAGFKSKDNKKAWEAFELAKITCMGCHEAEKIGFMNKQPLFTKTIIPMK
jgi:hypothetical protein